MPGVRCTSAGRLTLCAYDGNAIATSKLHVLQSKSIASAHMCGKFSLTKVVIQTTLWSRGDSRHSCLELNDKKKGRIDSSDSEHIWSWSGWKFPFTQHRCKPKKKNRRKARYRRVKA